MILMIFPELPVLMNQSCGTAPLVIAQTATLAWTLSHPPFWDESKNANFKLIVYFLFVLTKMGVYPDSVDYKEWKEGLAVM